jgi:hypothetical protein
MSMMTLAIRGERPKQFRDVVRVSKYDQLHARWTWTWIRKGLLMELDKLIEWLGRRLVQDLRCIWPILGAEVARISF